MHIFSRTAQTHGSMPAVLDWAARINACATDNSDLDFSLWRATFGAPVGSLIWSTTLESRAQGNQAEMQLMESSEFLALLEEGVQYSVPGGTNDVLRTIVHGDPPEQVPAVGSAAIVLTASGKAGAAAKVTEFGIEGAETVSKLVDAPVAFTVSAHGNPAEVAWLTLLDDIAAVDAAFEKLAVSAEYQALSERAATLLVEGSASQRLITRIA